METRNVTELVQQVKLEMLALGYSTETITNHDTEWLSTICEA